MQGAPGSGKSTLIKNADLIEYSISADDIRLYFGGVEYNTLGNKQINQLYGKEVWSLIYEIMDHKMQRGEFIILDSTMQKSNDLNMPLTLANKYNYEIYLFHPEVSLETAQSRNNSRDVYKVVDPKIINKIYENCQSIYIPENIKRINSFDKVIEPIIPNYDKYHYINIIGDIHGSYEKLKLLFKSGIKKDEIYIFTGDYFDHGSHIKETFNWIYDNLLHCENVIFLFGNHEESLFNFSIGKRYSTKATFKKTLISLKNIDSFKTKLFKFLDRLLDYHIFTFNSKTYIITHGGISDYYNQFNLLPAIQCRRGIGEYEENIDNIFTNNILQKNIIQIHGHRNYHDIHPLQYNNSWNVNSNPHIDNKLLSIKISHNDTILIIT